MFVAILLAEMTGQDWEPWLTRLGSLSLILDLALGVFPRRWLSEYTPSFPICGHDYLLLVFPLHPLGLIMHIL